ncbi:glycosyltransferase involved in cell wall biosynthesis [Variovorax guangxiensis]|uniref:Glycosyltransferase involved in cell wall biosynthesis n=1 Tax=Variovorax guangxiensis TaxID=1775474 RepID=A0A840FXX6_9BURK|nr:glycosyltransferase involved in cell wall biosynthesis [Variovorax guangxiensis]
MSPIDSRAARPRKRDTGASDIVSATLLPRARAGNLAQDSLAEGASRARVAFLSCVIPCRNEARNLALLLPQLVVVLSSLAREWEIVVVDDGSTDATAEVALRWRDHGVRSLELSRNFGKEAALSAGLDVARGDLVVLMDGDGQHPPELIPDMVARWAQGADMVCMVRTDRKTESWMKRFGTRLFYGLIDRDRRYRVPAGAGDFRLLDRQVVEALRALPERSRFMKGLFAWVGFRVEHIVYVPPPRPHGRSHYSLRALCSLSLTGITMFTSWPLRAASVVGGALALVSFGYGVVLAVSYMLWGNEVSGWTTIVVAMLLLAGVQLISLGVIGEYLARVFDEVKGRPLYLVKRSREAASRERQP